MIGIFGDGDIEDPYEARALAGIWRRRAVVEPLAARVLEVSSGLVFLVFSAPGRSRCFICSVGDQRLAALQAAGIIRLRVYIEE